MGMRIVFWQNMLSFHQEAHIVALVEKYGCEVVWVVQQSAEEDRKLLAWSPTETPGLTVVIAPTEKEIDGILAERAEDSFHILSGLRGFPLVATVIRKAHKLGLNCSILQERRPHDGFKSVLRSALFRLDCLRFGKSIRCVFVIGYSGANGGEKYFRSVGYPKEKLFPYGYFSRRPETKPRPATPGPFRMVYLGRCIPIKGGVDTVIKALSGLQSLEWTLDVIGEGELRDGWVNLARDLGLSDRIRFPGSMPHADAMEAVAQSDLLILPSRHDGWGFVVNEALVHGVPAFCSDHCGASDLLQEAWRGAVFPVDDVPVLRLLLSETLALGKPSEAARQRIWEWSTRIDGRNTAGYLLDVIRHCLGEGERPAPAWMTLATQPDSE